MPEGRSPILELQGITKSFGGVEALRGVDFALHPGEIHGLVGETGAGKSTLMKIIAGEQLSRFGIDVDPMSRLGDLPIGLQQLIEIARVLFSGARIVILDEPTSALSPPEVERLFATLRRLREEGTAIVFISHFIEDILRVSDTVTVFRNGRKVAALAVSATTKGALIEAMIGRGGEALEHSYTDDLMLPLPSDSSVVLK